MLCEPVFLTAKSILFTALLAAVPQTHHHFAHMFQRVLFEVDNFTVEMYVCVSVFRQET